jgi:hypothetical protein
MKGFLLVYPRSGSHLAMRLLTGDHELLDYRLRESPKCNGCIEDCYISLYPEENITNEDNSIILQYAHETRHDLQFPENGAYCTPDGIRNFSQDIPYVYLGRDPRNQIESYWILLTRQGNGKREPLDTEGLIYQCNLFKARAQRIIECMSLLDNYTYVKFEDLATNPVSTMSLIIEKLGFTPNLGVIRDIYKKIEPNTSYESMDDINYRYKNWSQEWRKIFLEMAGEELSLLGYN